MKNFIYLSATPEALLASMIPPSEFGEYFATGQKKRNRGQAIFFEIDLEEIKDIVDVDYINRRCVRHTDGRPKHTVYLSVYRALEKIPLKAFRNLYLTTESGITLELKPTRYTGEEKANNVLHLYQELSPVTPQIVSKLSPSQFLKTITDESCPVYIPKLFFVDLKLGDLASDPMKGSAEHLPYLYVSHLRDCLEQLKNDNKKNMKTVQRFFNGSLLYRTVETGFYIGDHSDILFYPYPTMAELEDINFEFLHAI
jgi:hypothetical protein